MRQMEAVGPEVQGQPEDRVWATDKLKKKRHERRLERWFREASTSDKPPEPRRSKGKNISAGRQGIR